MSSVCVFCGSRAGADPAYGAAADALDAAIAMQREIRTYNHARMRSGFEPIRVGMGLHAGMLTLGTIGDDERMEGTVIADSVNTTARIEEMNKTYDAYILISEEVLLKLERPEAYHYRVLDSVVAKGKTRSVTVYEVVDGLADYRIELFTRTRADFEAGVSALAAGDEAACGAAMRRVLEINPADRAAQIYLERLAAQALRPRNIK